MEMYFLPMKRRRTPKPITTELLDRLTYDAIVPAYSVLCRLGLHCSRSKYFWDSQRRNAIARIHRTSAPQRRHKAAEVAIEELIRVIDFLNERVEGLNRENQNLKAQGCRTRHNWVEKRWEAKYAEVQSRRKKIQSENERLGAVIAKKERVIKALRRQNSLTAALSPLEENILLLMGATGLGRSWRAAERLADEGYGDYGKGSVRNALRSLQEKRLLKEAMELGRVVRWSPPRGGGRAKLLLLSDIAVEWYETMTGEPAADSELHWAQRQHSSLAHGVGILEVADYLRARGYEITLEPEPILVEKDEPHGKRAEPDLIARKGDTWWPVEVQRKVSRQESYRQKWTKTLRLTGRLMLVLFSDERRKQQQQILRAWARRPDWPGGEVLLTSLESMIDTPTDWRFVPLG